MSETLSVRLSTTTQRRLDALAKRSNRSKELLAAKAIKAYVETEDWQLAEIKAGMADLEAGEVVSHEKIAKWLRSWGKKRELKPPA